MPTIQDKVAQAKQAGYSDEEITSYLSTIPEYSSKIKTAQSAGYKPAEIVSYVSAIGAKPAEPAKSPIMQNLEEIGKGAKEWWAHRYSQPGELAPLETIANLATGLGSSVVGGYRGLASLAMGEGSEAAAKAVQGTQQDYTYQPRTGLGKALTSAVALPVVAAKQGTAAIGREVGKAVAGDQGALVGEAIGDVLPDVALTLGMKAPATRGLRALNEAVTPSAIKSVAKGAADRVVSAITPEVSPEVFDLAQKATDKYGIPLRPDQIAENKYLRMFGELAEKVPYGGSKAEARQVAFNKAVGNLIGADENANKITPNIFKDALNKSGKTIGDISSKTDIPIDDALLGDLSKIVDDAKKFETSDNARIISNYVDEFLSKENNGVIPGEAFRKLNSNLGSKIRSSKDGDLRDALGNIKDAFEEQLQSQLSGEDAAALLDARRKYAIALQIEPLIAKTTTGDISPALLMGRATATSAGKRAMARGGGGDLGELARIGQQFLKEQPSSGTAERNLILGLGGGAAGGAVAGGTLGGIAPVATAIGASQLYNRLGPALTNQMLSRFKNRVDQQRILNQSKTLQDSATDKLRQRMEQGRADKLQGIGQAQSVDDAIKAAGD